MATQDIKSISERFPKYMGEVEKNYRRNLLLLIFDSSFFTFSTALLSQDTVIPAFLSYLTDNPILIGLIPAIFNLGFFLPQIISSFITHNSPKRMNYILFIAIMERVGILLIALVAQVTNVVSNQLVVAFFLLSFSLYCSAFGFIMPAYSDYISKAIYKQRGIFYGLNQALRGVIGFIASLVTMRILAHNDFPSNFRTLFWVSFSASFISPILIANLKEVPFPIQPARKSVRTFSKHILRVIRGNSNLRSYIYARQLIGLAAMGFSFLSLYAIKTYDLPASVFGTYTMIIIIAQSLSGVLWGMIGDRYGYKILLIWSTVLLFIQGLISLFLHHPISGWINSAIIGIVYSAINIGHPNLIFEISPPEETSLFIGLSNSLIAPIIGTAPILAGVIVDFMGYKQLFVAICVASIAAFFLSTFKFREPRDFDTGPGT